mmetsp:Transcript_8263/g.23312  ORF Transcript_8263/g.23312 Transcript_8263/m.23312 type:complete len:635 (-) Transcript_8263:1070-2974(-)
MRLRHVRGHHVRGREPTHGQGELPGRDRGRRRAGGGTSVARARGGGRRGRRLRDRRDGRRARGGGARGEELVLGLGHRRVAAGLRGVRRPALDRGRRVQAASGRGRPVPPRQRPRRGEYQLRLVYNIRQGQDDEHGPQIDDGRGDRRRELRGGGREGHRRPRRRGGRAEGREGQAPGRPAGAHVRARDSAHAGGRRARPEARPARADSLRVRGARPRPRRPQGDAGRADGRLPAERAARRGRRSGRGVGASRLQVQEPPGRLEEDVGRAAPVPEQPEDLPLPALHDDGAGGGVLLGGHGLRVSVAGRRAAGRGDALRRRGVVAREHVHGAGDAGRLVGLGGGAAAGRALRGPAAGVGRPGAAPRGGGGAAALPPARGPGHGRRRAAFAHACHEAGQERAYRRLRLRPAAGREERPGAPGGSQGGKFLLQLLLRKDGAQERPTRDRRPRRESARAPKNRGRVVAGVALAGAQGLRLPKGPVPRLPGSRGLPRALSPRPRGRSGARRRPQEHVLDLGEHEGGLLRGRRVRAGRPLGVQPPGRSGPERRILADGRRRDERPRAVVAHLPVRHVARLRAPRARSPRRALRVVLRDAGGGPADHAQGPLRRRRPVGDQGAPGVAAELRLRAGRVLERAL